MSPSAKIIADSISPDGVRLTTMEVVIHRFVLAEFNTHRVFSRNSASSRAIPVAKQIERIEEDLAWPVSWPAEQRGMQGGEELDEVYAGFAKHRWAGAADAAMFGARHLTKWAAGEQPLHKSLVNRLLEPFMWHTVVVTATAWENFFALRTDKDAQPEIREAAVAMQAAYRDSVPRPLGARVWHLPYVQTLTPAPDGIGVDPDAKDPEDWEAAREIALASDFYGNPTQVLMRVSAARCARVSYLTQDGKRDLSQDLSLYDRLITDRVAAGLPVHWSPLEHVATPWRQNRQDWYSDLTFEYEDATRGVSTQHLPRVGNLLGWRSLRTTVEAMRHERTYR